MGVGQQVLTCTQPLSLSRDGAAVACDLEVELSLNATTTSQTLASTQPLSLSRVDTAVACDLEVELSLNATTATPTLAGIQPLSLSRDGTAVAFKSRRHGFKDEPIVAGSTSSAPSVSSCSGSSDSVPVSRKARKFIARQQDLQQSSLAITQPLSLSRDGTAICDLEVELSLNANTATSSLASTQPLFLSRDGTAVACDFVVELSLNATTATQILASTQPLSLSRDGTADACDLEVELSLNANTATLPEFSDFCKRLPLTVGHPFHKKHNAPVKSRRHIFQEEPIVAGSTSSAPSVSKASKARSSASSDSSEPHPRAKKRIIIYESDSSESTVVELPAYGDLEHGGPVDLFDLWKAVPHRFQNQYLDLSASHVSDIEEQGMTMCYHECYVLNDSGD